MFVSLGFEVPVVIVREIPSHDGVVIKDTYVNDILEVPAPDWGFLGLGYN